jgi:hypothetical protein
MNIKLWGILVLLLIALGGASVMLSNQNTADQPERLKQPSTQSMNAAMNGQPLAKAKKATKEPGRVVVLDTTRGKIEFVLYEKDCPKTTARITDLVQGGFYNGVIFPRVEDWVIQTDLAKKQVTPMGIEITDGLTHSAGTVGMARANDPNSNMSVFYITLSLRRTSIPATRTSGE